jgi:hypothetical protein
MAIDAKVREELGNFDSADDLFQKAWSVNKASTEESAPTAESAEMSEESSNPSPMELFEQVQAESVDNGEESLEDNIAASANSGAMETGSLSDALPGNISDSIDIEEVFVKGPEGRKQKVKIDYSDRKATKQAYVKAAGMRKFQAERDAEIKSHKATRDEHVALKDDFDKIEKAFEASGAKGIVELIGGSEAWQKAVDEELNHRDYVSNLSADEKYQLEIEKRDKQYQTQLNAERSKREDFQKQIEAKEEQASLQQLESKLHPAFDRYRFAGKLGDTVTENLYDEAVWSKVKQRLGEYPDTMELNQAVIDKEFRTVSNLFRKHIKTQTEKQVKKTVENKKVETAKRAQVAATKGLRGSSAQRQILESLKSGNLSSALDLFNQGRK